MTICVIILIVLLVILAIRIFYELWQETKSNIFLKIISNNLTVEGDIKMFGLKSTQKVRVTLKPVDRLGNPAPVEEGSVSFQSSNENIFTIEQDVNNELEAVVIAHETGVAELNFSADADLGSGVETISGFSAVEITPASAVGFGIEVGTPEEQ